MEWQTPQALYLILPVTAGWLLLALVSNRRRQQAREAFATRAMWPRILPPESAARFWLKLVLRELAIVMGLVALAGPRFGTQYEQVVPRGSDLYVMIDVSRSMLANDVPPSRLGRAKLDVSALLNRLEGERVGLIAFAGQAVVKCPLTADYDSFRRALEELDPDSAPRGGTAIGDAIRKALEVFHAKADRDQAILLITDGDDQQSYPLEAAAVAAERHVAVFTVGLGDSEQGARIPQKGSANSYVEYQNEQVWSKLDNSLLEQIALKTSGVYVPAGTRSYDLGELYVNHLQGRRGNDAATQQKIRRSERYQSFLAIALAALLIDLCVRPYGSRPQPRPSDGDSTSSTTATARRQKARRAVAQVMTFGVLTWTGALVQAVEPAKEVKEGLRLYRGEKFDEARQRFATAEEELDKQKSTAAAAVAAFDEACADHRKGDLEQARENYLRAGLSQDLSVAIAAHFNLGNLGAEQARKLSGDKPALVPPEKRQEILDQLSQAVTAYRHCLELRPDHVPSRRNLELVRQWIKYYTDQWHQRDLQKRRDESNLMQFLQFLIDTQSALRESVNQLPPKAHADDLAELKRAQLELREEIPTLREKIEQELRQPDAPGTATPKAASKEVEEGIHLLQEWADNSARQMWDAADQLGGRDSPKAPTSQQAAIDELEKIWEAIVPFHPLLAKDLADQTSISSLLNPQRADQNDGVKHDDTPNTNPSEKDATPSTPDEPQASGSAEIVEENFEKWIRSQDRTLKRTRPLVPKAEAELQRLEQNPAHPGAEDDQNQQAQSAKPAQVDPEQLKEGYRKAIELGPRAVEEMEASSQALQKKDHRSAAEHADSARRILEEIQQAQPKSPPQQDQQNQNQQQQDKQQQDSGDQNKDDKQNDQQKQDQQKQDEQKNEKHSKDDKEAAKKNEKPEPQKQQAQVSPDRVEDALRKVRERQQEKRERDRKLKAQFLGKVPVDKDW